MYSNGESTPAIDTINSYNTTFIVEADNSVHFTSTRQLDPNASPEDYVIVLNEYQNMIVAYKTNTYVLGYDDDGRDNHDPIDVAFHDVQPGEDHAWLFHVEQLDSNRSSLDHQWSLLEAQVHLALEFAHCDGFLHFPPFSCWIHDRLLHGSLDVLF
jgi:hypothetical protein